MYIRTGGQIGVDVLEVGREGGHRVQGLLLSMGMARKPVLATTFHPSTGHIDHTGDHISKKGLQ